MQRKRPVERPLFMLLLNVSDGSSSINHPLIRTYITTARKFKQAIDILVTGISALKRMHSLQIVHGDIDPRTIGIMRNGRMVFCLS